MNSQLLIFHSILLLVMTISFVIHEQFVVDRFLIDFYVVNAFVAMVVYNLAYFFRKTQQDYLGYYFLAGTALKFFVFFMYVLPKFNHDGNHTKEGFFSFFVPYFVALLVETISLLFLVKNNDVGGVKN